eukprot:206765_1
MSSAEDQKLFLFLWHSISILICSIILIYSLFYIIFRRYVMTTMTKAAVRYSIMGVFLFVITLISSLNQVIALENKLTEDEINYYITNSVWTAAHIFTYLLFLNRLENSFITTKYKITKLIKHIFKIGIIIWTIFEVFIALNQTAISTNYYSHRTYHIYSLILLFIIQMVDLLLSIYLISLFLRNLHRIAFDQKINVSSIENNDDSNLDVLEMYDNDIVDEVIEISNNRSVSDSSPKISHNESQSDYLLLSENNNVLTNSLLSRNTIKNQHQLLNWGTKYLLLFGTAMISTQLSLLYNLFWIAINFWIKDNTFDATMTLAQHYIWSLNMLINCYVIYLDFDFAIHSYNCCCSECHKLCRLCCIACARNKVIGMTYNVWGQKPSGKWFDNDTTFAL